MVFSTSYIIVVIITSVIIIICSIGIILASVFQNKQRKKYNEVNNLIKAKKDATFQIKDGLTKEEINNIDSEVDIDLLIKELYNIYIELENKIKYCDTNLDNILVGDIKEFNLNRIKNFKDRGFADVTEGIDLVSYSIIEYSKEKLKLRLTINCFSYKTVNNQIVSGSNLEKIQKILLLTYQKVNNNWLISEYDKIYEKKLSK